MNYALAQSPLELIFSRVFQGAEETKPAQTNLRQFSGFTRGDLPRKVDEGFWANYLLQKCLSEVYALRDLEHNWDSYGASRPSEDALRNAVRALSELRKVALLPSRIRATSDQSVLFDIPQNGNIHLLEFFSDGDIVLLKRHGTTEQASDIAPADFQNVLQSLAHGI